MKKILSLLMALCLVVTIGAVSPLLAEAAKPTSGTAGLIDDVFCEFGGKNITWSFNSKTGQLSLNGKGEMDDASPNHGFYPPWYHLREKVKKIVISEGIVNIGTDAFLNCKNLISVSFPSSLKRIGDSAFSGCKKLKKITLPQKLESIDSSAFNGCVNLQSIKFPKKIKKIDGFAFFNCESLTSIVVPGSVKEIGHNAFENCTNLEKVTIQEGVERILWSAFRNCTKLSKISLPESLTAGEDGFAPLYSDSFDNTKIYNEKPNGVVYIGKYLYGVKGKQINSITIKKGTIGIINLAGMPIKKVEMPNSVKFIGESAFSKTDISSVKLSSGIKTIMPHAFEHTSLTEVTIPSGVEWIREYAFYGCDLKTIRIPASVKRIEENAFTSDYFDFVFSDDFTIIGHSKTAAEKYAKEYGINFEKLTPNPNANDLPSNQAVKSGSKIILTAPAKTTLYYTTDGTTPKTSSKKLEAGETITLTIKKDTTVKAFAVKKGMPKSDVVTRKYTIKATATPTTKAAPASKTFLKTTLITLTAPAKTTLYYTTDGTKPTAKNAKTVKPGQSRQVKIWKNTTLKVCAARSGYANSDIVTREYKIKSKKPNKTAVPVSKTVKRGKKITMTAPANTTLYYTPNGTTPKRASKT
ncbi:MAG: leucine-rich repeat protein, partial [Oscillospiraceae bacterium]|nr:leucine-rich repeat protein [Oscillospiraceae bacterium]